VPCTIVVGAQWGDEGKGKIVDALSADMDVVARYQGGPNAGHSVRRGDRTVVLHLVPSGVLHPGKRCLIGNGVVVDPAALLEEVRALEAIGVEIGARFGVSHGAHVILPYHRVAEAVLEQGPAPIGTTGRGIGLAYRDKAGRNGIRVGDLFDRARFAARAHANLARLRREFPGVPELERMTGAGLADELDPMIRWLEAHACDVSRVLHQALKQGERVLLEGAQGTLLDLDHGTYPYVTSSAASAAGGPLGVGIGPRAVDRVIGVTKAYATRVGGGPFPTEMPGEEAARLRQAGEEYGATTGRPRRCGWLDLPALRYAARINGLDGLVVTKLDVLDGFDEIAVCSSYEVGGGVSEDFPPGGRLEDCRPIWTRFPGWKRPTTATRRWKDLPEAARGYLEWIEKSCEVPILAVSVGAEREAEVRRDS
jgi:adenylosuccinate synthase